jgi:D-alanine-D-alanine ligase-like ATP-grasp enzyme
MLLMQIAPPLGISLQIEPHFGFAGELRFPSGKRHLFKDASLNVNGAASADIARDKAYAKFFLSNRGISVPSGQTFFSDRLNGRLIEHQRRGRAEAVQFATRIGFPIYVKPNNSSGGAFVTKVNSEDDLANVIERLFLVHDVVLIERPVLGNDFRLVVFDERLHIAYRRIPLHVIGDGDTELSELIGRAREKLLGQSSQRNANIEVDDFRIDLNLKAMGKSRSWVPECGRLVQLLDCANLSAGGSPEDVTELVNPEFAAIVVSAADALGLRFCGVDLIATDICLSPDLQEWAVIELSPSPGLDNYCSLGREAVARVHDLYRRLLVVCSSQ